LTTAITPKRAAARSSSSSMRSTSACSRDFSMSNNVVIATMPLANVSEPAPATRPEPMTTRPAASVVASISSRLAAA
jgi:hypothetical protein